MIRPVDLFAADVSLPASGLGTVCLWRHGGGDVANPAALAPGMDRFALIAI